MYGCPLASGLLAEQGGVVGSERRSYWQERYRTCAVSWRLAGSSAQKKSGCDRFCNHTRSS